VRITILAVGHRMPAWIRDGFHEYARRMPPELRLELVELKPQGKEAEGKRLLEAVPSGATLVALDEHGKSVTTQQLSKLLAGWMQDGTQPAFAVGGADGLADAVKESARMKISLSALTLPHALARVVLAEQIYRAWTILAGHPYHRE
jgi:23S rRNA (pseudouridine1915-N3)-methyltransferase